MELDPLTANLADVSIRLLFIKDALLKVQQKMDNISEDTMREAILAFKDSIGWTGKHYGKFYLYCANSVLGMHPNLKEYSRGYRELNILHSLLESK